MIRYVVALMLVGVSLSSAASTHRSWSPGDSSNYLIGVGIADVTGPSAGIGMMGYANPAQIDNGIHTRLFSRAYIIGDGQETAVFVTVDCGMISQILKMKVIEKLEAKYYGLYTTRNVLISGTHTHSGPAGFFQYLLFTITNLGYIEDTLDAMTDGIVRSIDRAHESIKPGKIHYNEGELLGVSINRSPTSYEHNPQKEKDKYEHNTDKTMHVLKFTDSYGNLMGVINWYAVHAVSMNNTNTHVSSDNLGLASVLLEKALNPGTLPGKNKVVAAFAQSNEGDSTPNIKGPHCIDTGEECELNSSSCNGAPTLCIAFGPGETMWDSTWIIGNKLFTKSWEILNQQNFTEITGPVKNCQQFIDMTDQTVTVTNPDGSTQSVKTCKPAMGYSFAAGTTDGPGAAPFVQGTKDDEPFWNAIRDLVQPPSEELIKCQHPKPILLATGEITLPSIWQPQIVEPQIIQVGNLYIVGVPGEFTTMSGRRVRNAVRKGLQDNGVNIENAKVVIAGLSNVYSDYIATYEEYQNQRYEGGSTIYGPHTLEAYLQQYEKMGGALAKDTPLDPGPSPPNLLDKQLSLVMPVIFDKPVYGHKFGDCVQQPYPLVYIGETVAVRFVAGHPRCDPMLEKTFLEVEKLDESSQTYTVVATDASWETKFTWQRTSMLLGESEALIEWKIPEDTQPGYYRIKHYGNSKSLFGEILPYQGQTNTFKVDKAPSRVFLKRRKNYPETPNYNS